MYLGIPIVSFIVTLFMRMQNWWEVSLLIWFWSILVFWAFWSACEFCLEVSACIQLIEEDDGSSLIADDPLEAKVKYWFNKAGKACVKTMRYRLSGKHHYYKKVDATRSAALSQNKCTSCVGCLFCSEDFAAEGLYSFVANKKWNPCFQQTQPERLSTSSEMVGNTYYVTRHSWSLEKLFCRSGGIHSAIPITQGESSITEAQINSNIVCNLMGNVVLVMLAAGIVVWLDLSDSVKAIVITVALIAFIWVGFATRRLFIVRNDVVNNDSITVFRRWEVYRHSVPKVRFIQVMVLAQICLFYLVPLIYLAVENPPSAALFSFLGAFSFMRHWLNPRILLMGNEKKDYFRNTSGSNSKEQRKKWKKKSRLFHLVAVGGDKARHFWTATYLMLVLFFVVVVLAASNNEIHEDVPAATVQADTLVQGYIYEPKPDLGYPTCRLPMNYLDLADYGLLAGLSYGNSGANVDQALNSWFQGEAINNVDLVSEFKRSAMFQETDLPEFGTAASYMLITFSSRSTAGVLSIR